MLLFLEALLLIVLELQIDRVTMAKDNLEKVMEVSKKI